MLIELPLLLNEMLAAGRWPKTPEEAEFQNRRPWVSTENIRRLAPDETLIYFFPPPFFTVRERSRENDFWNWPQTDPNGIDFDLAIDIGDFGLGSDAPILLDYRADLTKRLSRCSGYESVIIYRCELGDQLLRSSRRQSRMQRSSG
ncbi:MAG: hypothetical protein MI924_38220 [Chloroflexales bacterium]|nr:hypothetical protein [Chloroflexales bacterium]